MKLLNFDKNSKDKYIELATDFHTSPASFTPANVDVFTRNFEAIVNGEGVHGWFIMDNDLIIGYVLGTEMFSTEIASNIIWIEEFSVSQDYRGKGFGSKVIETIIDSFDEVVRFRLEVSPSNDKAISLYERLGFSESPYNQMYFDKVS